MATKMLVDLEAAGRTELIPIGATLASLVFNRENIADLPWLQRRLREMHNILRESPFYQEILQEGREEGLEKGRQEKLQVLRETLLKVVQARFPRMVRLAKGQAAIIDDPAALESLIVKVSIAQDAKEAQRALLDEEDEDD